jgi:transposase
MYLRRHHREKDGKDHVYWSLVESYRTAKGPRNRIVAYLGELKDSERESWVSFSRAIDGKALPDSSMPLFPEPDVDDDPVPETVEVRVRDIAVDATFDFGDIWLATILWRSLEFDRLFDEWCPSGDEDIRWHHLFAILAFARFCDPSSELHICDQWYPRTSLPLMLGVSADDIHPNRLYRTLDKLLPLKSDIEKHLKERLGSLFNIEYDILLYDITSTYFEGEAKRNPQAKRGYSSDKRPDCKQVCIGLVVTKGGLPLGYEVFDGNRSDVTTVEDIVEAMEKKYGRANRVWVMDRGMVDEGNLEYIRGREGRYIVGANRQELRKYEQALLDKDWEKVYEDLEVKKCASPDGEETFVLCRSASRDEKERAMHDRFSKRIEDALEKLSSRISRAQKRPNRDSVNRQIGRILQKNHHSAGRYNVVVEDDPARAGHLAVRWEINAEWEEWMKRRDGAYMLRTNIRDLDGETLWKMYTQLTDVEASFRCLKTDLGIRPVYHQKEGRVQAHILVAFLGYALFKTLETWCARSGLGRSARTAIAELGRLKCCRVALPTTSGRSLSVYCVTRPDDHQQALLDRLKLEIPRRLGRPRWRENLET